ncbi:hypothetical protein FOZ60_003507 [Perkinsus olseni]|uniref:Response regulatory domain-containing protein n=1 Tax=Perkinsus olseni TaxID=32597 RepID=A0A7J6NV67_PEROL|nr:hypothetical protein FOZ60_003507 [Perkinsus olseni]
MLNVITVSYESEDMVNDDRKILLRDGLGVHRSTFFIDLVCNAREVVEARSKKRAQKKELAQKMVMADEGLAGEGDDQEDLQNTIDELAVKEVLVIDDCDDTATILRPMLVDRAYKTNTVADGFAALDYFNTHPMPDIVIMETELPGNLPGLEFLSQET